MATLYERALILRRPDFLSTPECNTWDLENLTAITTVFGKNGSGKSLILRAWRDDAPETHHYVVPERSGEMDYQPDYLREEMTGGPRRNNTTSNYVEQYRRRIVARIQAYLGVRGNYRGPAPTPGDPAEVERYLTTLLPDFTITLRVTSPPYELRRVSTGAVVAGRQELSSGEIQLVTMGLDILTVAAMWDIENTTHRVILVDEPDAHIHPDLQVRFADFLVSVARRYELQLAVATHSTTLLAALGQFGGDEASIIYAESTARTLTSRPFSKQLRELASCLGGHALMGPLFSVPLLLVEGDDDYRIWSQVPRHHVAKLSAIPCGGNEIKEYQRTLERMFAALRETATAEAGFALIDADKGKPVASPEHPQSHIRYIQLACRESENLYLADETLAALGLTWAEAVPKIVAAAPRFGAKETKLAAVQQWNRKDTDIKDVIDQLTQILDPKNVHWTIRIARAVGTQKPTGQLAEFLSDEVIAALWPA